MQLKKQYISREGRKLWAPTAAGAMVLNAQYDGQVGFCLACGEDCRAEPDAVRMHCPSCAESKVYGVEYLIVAGRVL